nr:hypothetical protein CFP56_10887 [Quercus suber]
MTFAASTLLPLALRKPPIFSLIPTPPLPSPPTMQRNFSSISISPDLVPPGNSQTETSSLLCLAAPITTVRSLTST